MSCSFGLGSHTSNKFIHPNECFTSSYTKLHPLDKFTYRQCNLLFFPLLTILDYYKLKSSSLLFTGTHCAALHLIKMMDRILGSNTTRSVRYITYLHDIILILAYTRKASNNICSSLLLKIIIRVFRIYPCGYLLLVPSSPCHPWKIVGSPTLEAPTMHY